MCKMEEKTRSGGNWRQKNDPQGEKTREDAADLRSATRWEGSSGVQ